MNKLRNKYVNQWPKTTEVRVKLRKRLLKLWQVTSYMDPKRILSKWTIQHKFKMVSMAMRSKDNIGTCLCIPPTIWITGEKRFTRSQLKSRKKLSIVCMHIRPYFIWVYIVFKISYQRIETAPVIFFHLWGHKHVLFEWFICALTWLVCLLYYRFS